MRLSILVVLITTLISLPAAARQDGEQCSSHDECDSKHCQPGPGNGVMKFCTNERANCAWPGTTGGKFKQIGCWQGEMVACMIPAPKSWARFAPTGSKGGEACPSNPQFGTYSARAGAATGGVTSPSVPRNHVYIEWQCYTPSMGLIGSCATELNEPGTCSDLKTKVLNRTASDPCACHNDSNVYSQGGPTFKSTETCN